MLAVARRCGCGVVVAMTLAFVVAMAAAIVMAAVDASVAVDGLVSAVDVVFWGGQLCSLQQYHNIH